MGFGFKNPFKGGFKNPFKGGIGDIFNKGKNLFQDVAYGAGNLLTGGALAQYDATKEAEKARKQAQKQYEDAITAANTESARISNLEEERKRRLALFGTQNPQTLLGSYLGVGGGANVGRPTLG
jgi:hypothetical protein